MASYGSIELEMIVGTHQVALHRAGQGDLRRRKVCSPLRIHPPTPLMLLLLIPKPIISAFCVLSINIHCCKTEFCNCLGKKLL